MAEGRPYLIWSMLHRAWWRHAAQGYTADLSHAGVFQTPHDETFEAERERAVHLEDAKAEIEFQILEARQKIARLEMKLEALAKIADRKLERVA